MIPAVDFKDGAPDLAGGADQEKLDASGARGDDMQVGKTKARPDIRDDADAGGQVDAVGKQPAQKKDRPQNFLERLFGSKKQAAPTPQPFYPKHP